MIMLDIQQAFANLIFGSILCYVYLIYTRSSRRRAMIQEKGCSPINILATNDPIFGIDLFCKTLRSMERGTVLQDHCDILKMSGNNAKTLTFPSLGRQIIITVEPCNLKTMLALEFKNWSLGKLRKTSFTPFLGVGIFTSDGREWQHSREMLRPSFHRRQVSNLDKLEVHVQHLIKHIPRDGSTVGMQALFFSLTIDSATELLFGKSTLCLVPGSNTAYNARFAEAFDRLQGRTALHVLWGLFAALIPRKQFAKDIEYVHDFVDHYVEKALEKRSSLVAEGQHDSGRHVFIDELVRWTDDRVRIRSELLNILIAGRDTTASLLSNVWFTLSKRPDVWVKLRQDVDSLNGKRPTFEQLKELKYLQAVIKESLRLYPIVPVNWREAMVDTTLPLGGGEDGKDPIFIRKGQLVSWSTYAMHRRKDFYGEDAEKYEPERWLGIDGLRPGWEYLPFNGGPRTCIGRQFALTEVSYTTVRLMQEFRNIKSRDSRSWQESLSLTCVGSNGCKVALTS